MTGRARLLKPDGGWRTMTLDAVEFLRRFAGHVLPKGFVRMRYWGLLANRKRREKLALCRSQLGVSAQSPDKPETQCRPAATEAEPEPGPSISGPTCPHCGEPSLRRFEPLPRRLESRTDSARAPP